MSVNQQERIQNESHKAVKVLMALLPCDFGTNLKEAYHGCSGKMLAYKGFEHNYINGAKV